MAVAKRFADQPLGSARRRGVHRGASRRGPGAGLRLRARVTPRRGITSCSPTGPSCIAPRGRSPATPAPVSWPTRCTPSSTACPGPTARGGRCSATTTAAAGSGRGCAACWSQRHVDGIRAARRLVSLDDPTSAARRRAGRGSRGRSPTRRTGCRWPPPASPRRWPPSMRRRGCVWRTTTCTGSPWPRRAGCSANTRPRRRASSKRPGSRCAGRSRRRWPSGACA